MKTQQNQVEALGKLGMNEEFLPLTHLTTCLRQSSQANTNDHEQKSDRKKFVSVRVVRGFILLLCVLA